MSVAYSSYYGLTKVREASPDARDWAATDSNFELLSLVLKAFEQHSHNGTTGIHYPGYNAGSPTTPTLPTLAITTSGGILTPGVTVGVRLGYLNNQGLETDGSPETSINLGTAASRPLTLLLNSTTAGTPGLSGGTYIYVQTKKKAGGETLASDILPVDIAYDSTYQVTVGFSSINSYADGTDAINIYRAAGPNSPFQLLTTITSVSATSYVDNGSVPSGNVGITPPTVATFNASNKVRITFGGLAPHPATASKLRVYVTQQTGLWGTSALLSEVDLTGTPPTFVDYLGSEILQNGYPKNATQITNSPPKLNLATEATGAPKLTTDMSFQGYQALNFRLMNSAGVPAAPSGGTTWPANGDMYYDTSTNNVRAYINGTWTTWGTTTATAYSHPAEEAGGHVAANIKFVSASAVTAKTIFDRQTNSDGSQKNITGIVKVVGGAGVVNTNSTSATTLTDMDINPVTPLFNSQWIECVFSGHFTIDTVYAVVNMAIEYDGISQEETVRSITAPAISSSMSFTIPFTVQMGLVSAPKRVRVLWWVSAGTATAVPLRRSLVVKLLA